MNKTIATAAFALAALFCLPAQANMAMVITKTIQLDTAYTGFKPTGASPWLKATFTWPWGWSAGTLTLTSMLDGSDFVQGGKNANATIGWAFFLDESISSIECTGGTNCADDVFFGSDLNSGPVPAVFNLSFSWDNNDRFMDTDTAIYDIDLGDALMTSPFEENSAGWSSVAHIQGIAPAGCSGWIVAGSGTGASGGTTCGGGTPPPTTAVPGPNATWLFLLTVAGAGTLVTVRRARLGH